MKNLTQRQVNTKYKGRYVLFLRSFDYSKKVNIYEIRETYKEIRENTTLGEDVGTNLEYCR